MTDHLTQQADEARLAASLAIASARRLDDAALAYDEAARRHARAAEANAAACMAAMDAAHAARVAAQDADRWAAIVTDRFGESV